MAALCIFSGGGGRRHIALLLPQAPVLALVWYGAAGSHTGRIRQRLTALRVYGCDVKPSLLVFGDQVNLFDTIISQRPCPWLRRVDEETRVRVSLGLASPAVVNNLFVGVRNIGLDNLGFVYQDRKLSRLVLPTAAWEVGNLNATLVTVEHHEERKRMREIAVLTFEAGLISSLREYWASEQIGPGKP